MAKWIFRGLLALLLFFVLTSVIGFFTRRNWGKDVDTLEVVQGAFRFTAKRDPLGVWKIKTGDIDSLSFAFGYVHALDREFQTELTRYVATGRIASIFGDTLLASDRLLRFSGRAAEQEYAELEKTDPARAAFLAAYIEGRRARLGEKGLAEPVEYKIFSLKRENLGVWLPSHVLAISRYQAWTLSYDYRDDVLRKALDDRFPPELAIRLSPAETVDSTSLYAQPTVRDLPKRALAPAVRRQLGEMRMPVETVADAGTKAAATHVAMGPQDDRYLAPVVAGSNSWMVGPTAPGGPATLCNDPHLTNYWPSPVYPIEYEIDNERETVYGKGFSFPGTPLVVIGETHRVSKTDTADVQSLAWTITAANYVDHQELVRLEAGDLQRARLRKETYEIRNPADGSYREMIVDEAWTPWGPRVDDILEWRGGKKPDHPVALDWIGFRKSNTPFWFFYRRALAPSRGFKDDLATGWDYPAVNLSFYARDGVADPGRLGHVVTGVLYARRDAATRAKQRQLITKSELAANTTSFPGERPFLEIPFEDATNRFFVSGNQRVWSDELWRRLAYQGTNDSRSEQILSRVDENRRDPSHSQTDHTSRQLLRFSKWARSRIDTGAICAGTLGNEASYCQEALTTLFEWDGTMDEASWKGTFHMLWYQNLKVALWTGLWSALSAGDAAKTPENNAAMWELFYSWERTNFAVRFFRDLFENEAAVRSLEETYRVSVQAALQRSAKDTVAQLSHEYGFHTARWAWGKISFIDWQHPVGRIPGRLGTSIAQGLLGKPPAGPGTFDSPTARGHYWKQDKPLVFGVAHTAVMRMCIEVGPGRAPAMRWASLSGVSGNPFSKWAWEMAERTYWPGVLAPAAAGPDPK